MKQMHTNDWLRDMVGIQKNKQPKKYSSTFSESSSYLAWLIQPTLGWIKPNRLCYLACGFKGDTSRILKSTFFKIRYIYHLCPLKFNNYYCSDLGCMRVPNGCMPAPSECASNLWAHYCPCMVVLGHRGQSIRMTSSFVR